MTGNSLEQRLGELGRGLAERESTHGDALHEATDRARELHQRVSRAIDAYNRAVIAGGAPQLQVSQSEVRPDDKHLRSIQFDLQRGRHTAVITVKSRGEVTLVGPFRVGKVEGPCKSFPFSADREFDDALSGFLEEFLNEAATP